MNNRPILKTKRPQEKEFGRGELRTMLLRILHENRPGLSFPHILEKFAEKDKYPLETTIQVTLNYVEKEGLLSWIERHECKTCGNCARYYYILPLGVQKLLNVIPTSVLTEFDNFEPED